jgi:hypothetical protein
MRAPPSLTSDGAVRLGVLLAAFPPGGPPRSALIMPAFILIGTASAANYLPLLSIAALLLIFAFKYRPLIAQLDRDIKRSRHLLLLIPDAIAKTFLVTPAISQPTTSADVYTRRFDPSKSACTRAEVSASPDATTDPAGRPRAISLAMFGPVNTAAPA